MHAANNVLTFLIDTLFTLYIGAIIIRIILSITRADFYNPISQFIVMITNPTLSPLKNLLPNVGRIDPASWTLALVLQALEIFSLAALNGVSISSENLIVSTFVQIITVTITIFLYAVIIRAILSWFQSPQMYQNPLLSLLTSVTEPVLRLARKIIPPIGMFDLSAFVVILFLYSVLIALHSF